MVKVDRSFGFLSHLILHASRYILLASQMAIFGICASTPNQFCRDFPHFEDFFREVFNELMNRVDSGLFAEFTSGE